MADNDKPYPTHQTKVVTGHTIDSVRTIIGTAKIVLTMTVTYSDTTTQKIEILADRFVG